MLRMSADFRLVLRPQECGHLHFTASTARLPLSLSLPLLLPNSKPHWGQNFLERPVSPTSLLFAVCGSTARPSSSPSQSPPPHPTASETVPHPVCSAHCACEPVLGLSWLPSSVQRPVSLLMPSCVPSTTLLLSRCPSRLLSTLNGSQDELTLAHQALLHGTYT